MSTETREEDGMIGLRPADQSVKLVREIILRVLFFQKRSQNDNSGDNL